MGLGQGAGSDHLTALSAEQAFLAYEAVRHRLPAAGQPGKTYRRADTLEDIAEEFDTFKEEEVRRFKQARDTATAYEPSRPGEYFVVPKQGTEAADVHDFAVMEEPQNKLHRFDGGILKNPVTSKDPNTGIFRKIASVW